MCTTSHSRVCSFYIIVTDSGGGVVVSTMTRSNNADKGDDISHGKHGGSVTDELKHHNNEKEWKEIIVALFAMQIIFSIQTIYYSYLIWNKMLIKQRMCLFNVFIDEREDGERKTDRPTDRM